MVLKQLNWWMVLKEPDGLERSKLINGLERNQWSWKISSGLERSQWWMVLKEPSSLKRSKLINGLDV